VKRSFLLFSIPFVLFTVVFFVLSRNACNKIMQAEATSQIPFMHKTHVQKYGIDDCTVCHKYDENGRFKGIPTIGECTACHARDGAVTAHDHLTPRKKTMFDSYKDTDRPWTSWSKQPDLVYFSHLAVMSAKYENGKSKVKCESCHGDKANAIDNRMIKGRMPMGQCMDCHTALKISNKCAVCHD
jgi:hypothetical protein